jgi:hypothetical protein
MPSEGIERIIKYKGASSEINRKKFLVLFLRLLGRALRRKPLSV